LPPLGGNSFSFEEILVKNLLKDFFAFDQKGISLHPLARKVSG